MICPDNLHSGFQTWPLHSCLSSFIHVFKQDTVQITSPVFVSTEYSHRLPFFVVSLCFWVIPSHVTFILTDSGRRSTLTWSPSSKPSGTLFCINRGMLRFRFFSDTEPFCHCSSCLRESTGVSWRRVEMGELCMRTDDTHCPQSTKTQQANCTFHVYPPSISSLTAWESTDWLSSGVSCVLASATSLWPAGSGLCHRFFWIRGMISSFGFSDGFVLQNRMTLASW